MYFKNLHIILSFLLCLCTSGILAQRGAKTDSLTLFSYPGIAESILQTLENNGYPFASTRLQNDMQPDGTAQLRIIVDSNLFITFDSIILKGDAKLSKGFLYPYLGLRHGMPYCEKQMRAVDRLLAEIPYTNIVQPSGVEIVNNTALLYVYLNKQNVNYFDGYIGLVPVDEQSGKVSVNGEVTLSLQNLFGIGEQFDMHWYSSERYSQHLELSARFPYLFRTRFGINGTFQLDKQDTSYLTMNYHIGVPYSFRSNNYVEPFCDYSSSIVLNPELLDFTYESSSIDYSKTLWGISTRLRKLDYLPNPHSGIDFCGSFSVGRRVISTNSQVDATLYEGLTMQQTTWKIEAIIKGFIPVHRHWVIALRAQTGSLLSGPHYDNELFRIGGEEGIRGFNTNDLMGSTYLIYATELRFLFARNSYANIFFDGGAYEQQLCNNYLKDKPFGFGVGLHLAVKSGILYIEYALGRQMGNPITFKSGKIHLGIKVSF